MRRFTAIALLILGGIGASAQTPTPAPPPAGLMNWSTANTAIDVTYPTTTNQVLGWDNTNKKFVFVTNASGGSTPGGSTTQVQYNNAGAFAGSSLFTFDGAGKIALTINGVGAAGTPAIDLLNTTAATSTVIQNSPSLHLRGSGWKTTATAASQAVEWQIYATSINDTTNPQNYLNFDSQTNAAGYTNRMTLWSGNPGGFGSRLFVDNYQVNGAGGLGYIDYNPQTSIPATPASNHVRVYSDNADGHLYGKDSAGTAHDLFSGGTTVSFIRQTSNYTLTSQTAAQQIFNSTTNGRFTCAANTTYRFHCVFALNTMSATSGTFGFALGGTATITQGWKSQASKGAFTSSNADQANWQTAANTALTPSNTATAGIATIDGTIRVTTAGTLIPQVSLTVAAAAVIQADSFFEIWPIGSNTVTNVGNWD